MSKNTNYLSIFGLASIMFIANTHADNMMNNDRIVKIDFDYRQSVSNVQSNGTCLGVLLNPLVVLTSSECVYNKDLSEIDVSTPDDGTRVGYGTNLSHTVNIYSTKKNIGWKLIPNSSLALLKLSKPINFTPKYDIAQHCKPDQLSKYIDRPTTIYAFDDKDSSKIINDENKISDIIDVIDHDGKIAILDDDLIIDKTDSGGAWVSGNDIIAITVRGIGDHSIFGALICPYSKVAFHDAKVLEYN